MRARRPHPGSPSVQVHAQAGGLLAPTVFTDIAFEMGQGVLQLDSKCAFVSTASGAVFVVNCNRCVGGPAAVAAPIQPLLTAPRLSDPASPPCTAWQWP
jgi:hypothetical protein